MTVFEEAEGICVFVLLVWLMVKYDCYVEKLDQPIKYTNLRRQQYHIVFRSILVWLTKNLQNNVYIITCVISDSIYKYNLKFKSKHKWNSGLIHLTLL